MPLRRIQEIIDEGVMKYYYRSAEGANLEVCFYSSSYHFC